MTTASNQADQRLITAIVGGGHGCAAILRMIEEDRLGRFLMTVKGVADIDLNAPGMTFARELGIDVTTDYRELYDIPDLDLVVELTGADEVRDELERTRPRHVRLIDHFGARLFWQLHQAEEAIIVQRTEMKQRVEEERRRIAAILDNAPVMVVASDPEGRIVSFNRRAQVVLGYSADEVLGKLTTTFYRRPEEREALVRRALANEVVQDYETTLVCKDGTEMPVAISLAALWDNKGDLVGTVVMSRNISARKALMNKIIKSERLAAVGRLAAGVAHEINNPLAVISEMAGYLEDLVTGVAETNPETLEKHLKHFLPRIGAQVRRCRSITSRLLRFSRKDEHELERTNPADSLDEIIPLLEKQASLANITLHRDWDEHLPVVQIAKVQFEEILLNLVTNAIQAMTERRRGNIWLSSKTEDNRFVFTVRDDGPGIDKAVSDRIFEPFVTTKPVGQGTGLGLAICFGIIKQCHGEIRVTSEPGEGAQFDVFLLILPDEET